MLYFPILLSIYHVYFDYFLEGVGSNEPHRILTIRDLFEAFDIDSNSSTIHNMPSFEQRSNRIN